MGHQIVRRAALILQQAGHEVLFYEDFPYVERDPAGLEIALDRSGTDTWQPVLIDLDEADLACKVEAIAAYRSQIGVLFGDTSDVAPKVKACAQKIGGGACAERLWRLNAKGSEALDLKIGGRGIDLPLQPLRVRHPSGPALPAKCRVCIF